MKRFPGYRETAGAESEGTEPELLGKHGRILPFDDETLAVVVVGIRRLRKLALLPGAVVFTEGDEEGTVHVPNALLDAAALAIGAPKRRRVTEERRDQLKRAGSSSRFGKITA